MSNLSPISAFELVESQNDNPILSFGCEYLDELMKGGLCKGITELSGEAGAAKTQIALQLLLQVQMPIAEGGLEGGAFFLSTEGEVPVQRLNQMQAAYKRRFPWAQQFDFLDNIYLTSVDSVAEQQDVIKHRLPMLLAQRNVKLVVIDSMAGLFRVEFSLEQSIERAEQMIDFAAQLKMISHKFNVPVLVTNQVTDLFPDKLAWQPHLAHLSVVSSGRRIHPALGLAWASCVDHHLMLSRSPCRRWRSFHVLSTPRVPPRSCPFVVDADGVRGEPDLP